WQEGGRKGDFHAIRLQALQEVGPSVFFSLLVIAVAFLPVFTLVDQEGRLFKPLAYSKTLAMAMAAILAVTLDPALRMLFTRMDPFPSFRRKPESITSRWTPGLHGSGDPARRMFGGPASAGVTVVNALIRIWNTITVGRYYPEEQHPISRLLFRLYEPACRWALEHRKTTLGVALGLVVSTVPIYFMLGSEFMPPLNEGAFLYMPTALPGMSVTQAQTILQIQDKILKSFPQVDTVFGKAGRADTSTDPAPLSMVETTVVLKPESQWPKKITMEALQDSMDAALKFPGMPNIWTMPIKNRIDMLSTGIRTPVGVKILGPDLSQIQKIGENLENVLREVPGTRSVYAERTAGGYYIDFDLKREELARYGLTVDDAQMIIRSAIGGENIATTV